ncbi:MULTISPECIES: hypothetical protein [Anaerococcus]|nr:MULTISPECIES: hypothetical protein [Anaerococcus]MDU5460222.1 hypothetical protein [Anaerococcus vaginalis]
MYVYDNEEIDGQINQKVEIHYKFIDKLNLLLTRVSTKSKTLILDY